MVETKRNKKICPKRLCFNWLEKGSSFAPGLYNSLGEAINEAIEVEVDRCNGSFGRCLRDPNGCGERDLYEPCEPFIEQLYDEILKYGVTGIWLVGEAEPPKTDLSQFKKLVYESSVNLHANVIGNDFDLLGKNFYSIKLEFNQRENYILLNASYPFIAIADSIEPFNIQFGESPLLENEFRKFYRVLTLSELSFPIDLNYLGKLNNAENKEINYWKPEYIGDLVFNYWG